MNYIFIDGKSIDQHEHLLLEYEQKIFIKAFPDADERESFVEDIIPRIKDSENTLIRTYCILAVDDTHAAVGGLVADWYPGCGSLELIYIAVDPDRRKGKIGKNILDKGIELIQQALKEKEETVKAIFLEVDIPTTVMEASNSMDPIARLKVWDAWGAKRIPINYTQPPLSKGKQPVSNLMLMCLTGHGTPIQESIPADTLKEFLTDFYKGLDAEGSEYLVQMCEDVDIISEEEKIELFPLTEIQSAEISNSVVTTHFSVIGKYNIKLPEICNSFNSYECDLMNYTNQKNRPFKTKFVKLLKGVTIHMPSFYSYTSEGITNYRLSLNTELRADISISISIAADKDIRPIAHVTILPCEDGNFNNLDFLKFITNFGSRQEQYKASGPVKFEYGGKYLTYEELVGEILMMEVPGKIEMIGEGATQFDITGIQPCEEGEYEDGDFDIEDFFTTRFESEGEIKNSLINRMLCGLILGIFDYNRMNEAEIEDTIRPIVKASDSFFVACRGHIFKIEEAENSVSDEYAKILISPYLLVPSTTLAFNGLALQECEKLILDATQHRFSPNLISIIQRAEVVLSVEYIEDIFQYNSEIEIIREGKRQRCMDIRYSKLNRQIEIIKKRTHKSSDIIMEALLAILAIFGVYEAFSKGMEWNAFFVLTIVGLLAIEFFRWYKVRNINDL
jgi:hypothetical protein